MIEIEIEKETIDKFKKMNDMLHVMCLGYTLQVIKPKIEDILKHNKEDGDFDECFELIEELAEEIINVLDNVRFCETSDKIRNTSLALLKEAESLIESVIPFHKILSGVTNKNTNKYKNKKTDA
jgi:glycyl-tRNA synthetase beta subunit